MKEKVAKFSNQFSNIGSGLYLAATVGLGTYGFDHLFSTFTPPSINPVIDLIGGGVVPAVIFKYSITPIRSLAKTRQEIRSHTEDNPFEKNESPAAKAFGTTFVLAANLFIGGLVAGEVAQGFNALIPSLSFPGTGIPMNDIVGGVLGALVPVGSMYQLSAYWNS